MALFVKKKEEKAGDKGPVVGFTKPKRFLFFKIKSKPIYSNDSQSPQPQPQVQTNQATKPNRPMSIPKFLQRKPAQAQESVQPASRAQAQPSIKLQHPQGKPNQLQMYFMQIANQHKDLEAALRAQNMKESPYEFVQKMFTYSIVISVVITIAVSILLVSLGLTPILGIVLGFACYFGLFNKFISYPLDRSKVVGKDIEKDILFAARDLVISMRSGMPLFNAITAVSTGYGAASLEFAKVVELVQLGTPIEQALDEVSNRSQSKTFKRIMLQATVSLKAGADVVGALQGVVDEVEQERVIELRRYGQRLNALAMFYMLFGVIFPSMGIAVAAILTTFISLFTVDENTLLFAVIGIFFLQVIFLNIMRSSRPTFAM